MPRRSRLSRSRRSSTEAWFVRGDRSRAPGRAARAGRSRSAVVRHPAARTAAARGPRALEVHRHALDVDLAERERLDHQARGNPHTALGIPADDPSEDVGPANACGRLPAPAFSASRCACTDSKRPVARAYALRRLFSPCRARRTRRVSRDMTLRSSSSPAVTPSASCQGSATRSGSTVKPTSMRSM